MYIGEKLQNRVQAIQHIAHFLATNPKYKIAIAPKITELEYINVGYTLSEYIADKLSLSNLTQLSTAFLQQHLLSHTQQHTALGQYIALTNLTILQEPELKIDAQSLLAELSKSVLIVIDSTDGQIDFCDIPICKIS